MDEGCFVERGRAHQTDLSTAQSSSPPVRRDPVTKTLRELEVPIADVRLVLNGVLEPLGHLVLPARVLLVPLRELIQLAGERVHVVLRPPPHLARVGAKVVGARVELARVSFEDGPVDFLDVDAEA